MEDAGQKRAGSIPIEERDGQANEVGNPARSQVGDELDGPDGQETKEKVRTHRLNQRSTQHGQDHRPHSFGLRPRHHLVYEHPGRGGKRQARGTGDQDQQKAQEKCGQARLDQYPGQGKNLTEPLPLRLLPRTFIRDLIVASPPSHPGPHECPSILTGARRSPRLLEPRRRGSEGKPEGEPGDDAPVAGEAKAHAALEGQRNPVTEKKVGSKPQGSADAGGI